MIKSIFVLSSLFGKSVGFTPITEEPPPMDAVAIDLEFIEVLNNLRVNDPLQYIPILENSRDESVWTDGPEVVQELIDKLIGISNAETPMREL